MNRKRGFIEIGFLCLALLLIDCYAGAKDLLRESWLVPSLFFAGWMMAFIVLMPRVRIPDSLFQKESHQLLLLLLAAILPRAVWWLAGPVRIESDYGFYVRLGREFAQNGWIQPDAYLLTIAPNAGLFSAVLGLAMRLFGSEVGVAQALSMAFHGGNLFLLYAIGRKMTSSRRAFFAALVFALLPENVLYSTLPGIEAISLFTLLSGLLTVLAARERKGVAACARMFFAGVLLAFSACLRPSAWAVIAACPALLILDKRCRKSPGIMIGFFFAFLAGLAAVMLWYHHFQGWIFGGQRPTAGIGWSLYEGLDLESGGRWTEEKSRRCIEVTESFPPAEANRIFMAEAMERYAAYTFPEKILLFFRKGGALWFDSRYAVFSLEGTASFDTANAIANGSWRGVMALWIAAMLYRWKHPLSPPERQSCALPFIVILLTSAWHQAGTSIGRYHYMLIPFVLLIIILLLPAQGKRRRNIHAAEPFRTDADTD